jgi:hypothetical protein
MVKKIFEKLKIALENEFDILHKMRMHETFS